jgi:hypothetical protein
VVSVARRRARWSPVAGAGVECSGLAQRALSGRLVRAPRCRALDAPRTLRIARARPPETHSAVTPARLHLPMAADTGSQGRVMSWSQSLVAFISNHR